jgi:hypothetical protein
VHIDFHHAVTYVLARIAGFAHPEACIIGYASQYVDDARNSGLIRFKDGRSYGHIASAQTRVATQPREPGGPDPALNPQAWIPFHFLPGNLGRMAGEGLEVDPVRRLVCTTDSYVAAAMCVACIDHRHDGNGLHRLGVTSHVYADTWAHQGFAGLEHPCNRVAALTLEGVAAPVLQGASLAGHAMVQSLPDLPYLTWSFTDADGQRVLRRNPDRFLHAADRLVALHRAFRGEWGGPHIGGGDRDLLERGFTTFTDPDPLARHEAWWRLVAQGRFSFGALSLAELADLHYVAKGRGCWKHQALGTEAAEDEPGQLFPWTQGFEASHWKRFHDALKDHRAEVLERILPKFQLPTRFDGPLPGRPGARPEGRETTVPFLRHAFFRAAQGTQISGGTGWDRNGAMASVNP